MDKIVSVSNIVNILRKDSKNIFRDPLFALVFIAPFLIIAVVFLGFPLISKLLLEYLGFDSSPYYPPVIAFMSSVPGLLCGAVAGLMLLDDRDEKILMQISITPFGLVRYFIYRTGFLSVLCFIFSMVFLLLNPLTPLNWPKAAAVSVSISIEAIILALFLAVFASNKVQGLTLAKAGGVLLMGPFTAFFIPAPFNFFTAFIPTFWNGMVVFADGIQAMLYAAGGLIVHLIILFLFTRKARKTLS